MNTISGYLRQAGTAARFLLLATIVLGLLYPLAVFGAGQLAAPFQANGSIVKDSSGQAAASALIVQAAADDSGTQSPQWFHARPSAVTWDPSSSSASNLGPNDPKLLEAVTGNRAAVAASEGVSPGKVPADALTSSGSGLDPHISKDYANLQVPRVSTAHGLSTSAVQDLVDKQTSTGLEAFFGQPSVNVTLLNLDLAHLAADRR
ncbi:potassium-transporting ATPase subunit C [Paenarthrobacter aurescens]|uniref:Potassium-transporting ATPase KdpC subunit n=1 Tax=Paenarthrobacter aurescens TaxID=43663 RepID=A0A4Y3NGD1_PAEAU|nr:potassium-transporting ATPase subunit C [Paenarthrobacter aurescens]MDO6144570.1 potassium-transporting ATPase subunit C [Paenarthrobacter aurescens]MDO6148415.1 potassium-transporting ATPase subunit C [Paenarthrobacter aurescens]MDO6159661.1 potassium-transporting ATPase subunit C [Paenarthrobacter aurescens]MDO6164563.1 potassium-transporting ATPase subunit C [Paenarthrobacter aurescens]GEB17769.1 potassium-transporting ATPase KdpC subunit [Paenarthrobacter aurescens]